MTDQILCPDCGHDIDDHSWDGCQLEPPERSLDAYFSWNIAEFMLEHPH